jgi:hypothetical protein
VVSGVEVHSAKAQNSGDVLSRGECCVVSLLRFLSDQPLANTNTHDNRKVGI